MNSVTDDFVREYSFEPEYLIDKIAPPVEALSLQQLPLSLPTSSPQLGNTTLTETLSYSNAKTPQKPSSPLTRSKFVPKLPPQSEEPPFNTKCPVKDRTPDLRKQVQFKDTGEDEEDEKTSELQNEIEAFYYVSVCACV